MSTNEVEPTDSKPTMPVRLLSATPIFALFIFLSMTYVIIPKFERLYKEMDLGNLPFSTTLLLRCASVVQQFPYIIMPGMFAIAWSFFGWGCQTKKRMLWFSWVATTVGMILFFWILSALFVPLLIIMEKIGK